LSVEELKNKESSPHEQVETLNDVRDEQIESHEDTRDFLFASDQAGFQLDEFSSLRLSSNSSDAEVPGITGNNIKKPNCYLSSSLLPMVHSVSLQFLALRKAVSFSIFD